jgi:hypothetical protein
VPKVPKELKERQVLRELKEEPKVLKERQVLKVLKEVKELKVPL